MNDSKAFRQCLGKFATGVTVVTCTDATGKLYGITANSFSSVSLEPPLILWNIAKVAHSLEAYLNASHFAINVLSAAQQPLSAQFARSDHTRFTDVDYALSSDDAPIFPDSLAVFECRTHQIHDCGDHYVIIGEVTAFRSSDDKPLLFYGGDYRSIEK